MCLECYDLQVLWFRVLNVYDSILRTVSLLHFYYCTMYLCITFYRYPFTNYVLFIVTCYLKYLPRNTMRYLNGYR